jgi:hypothetical protein
MKLATAILALFFLITGFIPRADYAELSKLPTLLTHYDFHVSSGDKSMSFLAFLNLHYNDTTHNEDGTNHDDLPFHHHDQCAGGILISTISTLHFSFINTTNIEFFFQFSHTNVFMNAYFGNIWQPPCIV